MKLSFLPSLLVGMALSMLPLYSNALAAENSVQACADPEVSPATTSQFEGRPPAFDAFLQPLVDDAMRRRNQARGSDPSYAQRVDGELGDRRLNVALMGYGEEHGQNYVEMGVSITILSLDLDTWQLASISLSRDIRTPELEDQTQGVGRNFQLLRDSYYMLGFQRMRPLLETITSLPIDYQIVMKDVLIRNYLDQVSGPVSLTVPKDFHTSNYRLAGVEHGSDYFQRGPQVLDAGHAMTFILGEEQNPQGKEDERSYRKNLLMKAVLCQIRQRFEARDAGFMFNLVRFALAEMQKGDELLSDFDFGKALSGIGLTAQILVTNAGHIDTSFPSVESLQEVVIHDKDYGDGGVRRVHRITSSPDQDEEDHPLVKSDAVQGILPGNVLIPIGGNPYAANLITDYWISVRNLVRSKLLTTD